MGGEQSKEADVVLPPGWISKTDEATGREYYVNTVEGVTTWTKPASVSKVLPPPPPPPPSNLPPGWEAKVDPTSKQLYYVDHVNRISTWKRPTTPATLKSTIDEEIDVVVSASTPSTSNSFLLPEDDLRKSDHYAQSLDDNSTIRTMPTTYGRTTKSTVSPSSVSLPSPSSVPEIVDEQPHHNVSSSTVTWSGTAQTETEVSPIQPSNRSMNERRQFPSSTTVSPVSQDIQNWILLEAPKQRELAPKGLHAYRKKREKRAMDNAIAPENVEARNVSVNGYFLTIKQVRWFAVQYGVRLRSDTHYWYDPQSGFMGKLGGPIKFIVEGNIECPGKMHVRSSLGESTILINGREITDGERKLWEGIDMQLRPNTQYIVDPDGTTSRVGDDQPLYNWKDKAVTAQKKRVNVATSKMGFAMGILGMIGKNVVAGLAVELVNGLIGG